MFINVYDIQISCSLYTITDKSLIKTALEVLPFDCLAPPKAPTASEPGGDAGCNKLGSIVQDTVLGFD